ncbi:MAG: putative polymerase subfamily sigma factor [Ilumatobacteraceae bacterium]|nr:putative polymerase subfamily sigma factor [Ilumatobacteraceae bacterium]
MNPVGRSLRASDRTGSVDLFGAFYEDRYRAAVRLAIALTGSVAVAEDLVQDVMSDAHRHWARIAEYDNPAAWLRRAIVNRSVSRHRRLAVAARGLLRLGHQTRLTVDLAERDWELWDRVRELPARQAQLIGLVYVEGLTIESAADTLGISVPTAKSHIARGKDRLRHELSEWRTP